LTSDDFYSGDKDEILGQQHASHVSNLVIAKIYEGELGEDPFETLQSFIIKAFGKSSNELKIIVALGVKDDLDLKYDF
jgi:hypothetical protein